MMNLYHNELNRQHQHELLCEAENLRLAQLAQADGSKPNSLYAHLMAGLGRQMVELGQRLQEQFDAESETRVTPRA